MHAHSHTFARARAIIHRYIHAHACNTLIQTHAHSQLYIISLYNYLIKYFMYTCAYTNKKVLNETKVVQKENVLNISFKKHFQQRLRPHLLEAYDAPLDSLYIGNRK